MPFPPIDHATRDRLTGRFGVGAAAWLDTLPDRAAALTARWEIAVSGPLLAGNTSVVTRCSRLEGGPAILKLTPDRALAREELAALIAWQSPNGDPPVPAVLAHDDAAGALLLEAIVPGLPLLTSPVAPPIAAVGALLRGLRSPAPTALPSLRSLSERVDWIFRHWLDRHAAHAVARRRVPTAALERGHRLAALLAADPAAPRRLVHGDLHAGNVLDGGPARGLVAIDPRACVGDPAFDAVDLILWGAARVGEVERRIAELATATDDDPDRLRGWCSALAAMAAASLARRAGDEHPPAIEQRIDALLALAA